MNGPGDWRIKSEDGSQNICKGMRKVPGAMVNFAEVEGCLCFRPDHKICSFTSNLEEINCIAYLSSPVLM
jgi:hypothetical protein